MSTRVRAHSAPPRPAIAWLVSGLLTVTWGTLRLAAFADDAIPLTYVLPLLVSVWTRDRRMLWTMAGTFAVFAVLEYFWLLPAGAITAGGMASIYGATLFNIIVGASAVHLIIDLRDRLEGALGHAEAAEQQVRQQAEELAQQNTELTGQAEELSVQNEELAQVNEELQAQSEEIHALNDDLGRRERLLQSLLDAARFGWSEADVLENICAAGLDLFERVAMIAVDERRGDLLVPRAVSGLTDKGSLPRNTPVEGRFAAVALGQQRSVALNDASLRPDLWIPQVEGAPPFRAVLCSPLEVGADAVGTISVYSHEAREWTDEEFRLADWLAGHCSIALEMLRLQAGLRRRAALVDLSPNAIVTRKPEGEVTFWSAGAAALYGYSPDEALGRPLQQLLRTRLSEPPERVEERLKQTDRWTGELVHVTRSGREVTVESRWLAERDDTGQIAEVLESNVDITARKRAELTLREADRRKSEFLATLSHELRNPLAAIRYALDLLGRTAEVDPRPRQVIERQLSHLVRLVDDLLDVTRIASNKFQLQLHRVDLAAVIQQAVEAAAPEIERHRHELRLVPPPDLVELDADADRLAQVLTNLLNNAARYTPPGGRITLASELDGDGHVILSVADNGIGLAEQDRGRVFEMFTQLDERPGRGGLGIGLALVKAVVELHGGTVEARSSGAGQGSEFLVRLPVAAGDVAPRHIAAPIDISRSVARHILVVDDNADAAEMMRTVLDLDGHVVRVAHSGAQALALLAEFTPEIALLDIGLPDMDGYELALRLREHQWGDAVHFVAVTGWGQEEDRRRTREHGFHAHITKPAEPDEVSRLIASMPSGNGRSQIA